MPVEVSLPQLSEEEGAAVTLSRWLAAEGDAIAPEQDLVEVLTDKAAFILPAPAGGRLTAIRAAEGTRVAFGDVLGIISEE